MAKQPVVIRVWCREEDLHKTAGMLSWTVGHRVEIPEEVTHKTKTYFFIITEIEEYEDENVVRASMGFDIIGKVSGVIDWEVMPKEFDPKLTSTQNDDVMNSLLEVFDNLPIPISIVQRADGTFAWKWRHASGQAPTMMEAVKAALIHIMKSYKLIQQELIG
ncbi:hypothetical protein [Dictyobacter aurantiacus]|uniref:Uncharacterized protein n=1 Tax=Dictyobacter aurantiacus TaxID=1936993 RepID=A0A401ZLE4_9CHLR|nr:hypothetical protein [Dictyobacter aurantiacus]GCE07701.1 hypothetical protein KDAU_50300 [Dictyobacter aurantiacus]